MTGALDTHYARALADAVFADGSTLDPKIAVEQVQQVARTITESKLLERALLSPAVNRQVKSNVIRQLAEQLQVHPLIRNFLLVLINHRRTGELVAIRDAFEAEVDERTGWIPAEITSAQPLSAEEREQVERALGSRIGKYIRAHYRTDENLIAGIRARVGTTEYDASLQGRLEGLRQRLGAR